MQLETTKYAKPRTSGSIRYDMMRDALINNPALMKIRLVHGEAAHGEYDEIIAPEAKTLDVGWLVPFKKVYTLARLDNPKNAVLTAESPRLFINRKAYLLRIPALISGIILVSMWLLMCSIVVSSKQLINEQQNSASSIEMQQLRINKIFHCSQIGMAVLSLNGDIQEANEATCRFLGRTCSEMIGMNLKLLVMRDDYPDIQNEIPLLIKGDKDIYTTELRFARPDGKQV